MKSPHRSTKQLTYKVNQGLGRGLLDELASVSLLQNAPTKGFFVRDRLVHTSLSMCHFLLFSLYVQLVTGLQLLQIKIWFYTEYVLSEF